MKLEGHALTGEGLSLPGSKDWRRPVELGGRGPFVHLPPTQRHTAAHAGAVHLGRGARNWHALPSGKQGARVKNAARRHRNTEKVANRFY